MSTSFNPADGYPLTESRSAAPPQRVLDNEAQENALAILRCSVCGANRPRPLYTLSALDGPYTENTETNIRLIFKCVECGYAFVFPVAHELYSAYYDALTLSYHDSHDGDVSRYREVLDILALSRIRRILDWGCGTGSFLALLPGSIEKFGVDGSRAAAEKARCRGIETVLPSEDALRELYGSFDAITAIDVLEHISDLSGLKKLFAKLLRPGGQLVLLTGDSDSPSAKAVGRYWYYMHYAEHISFLSQKSIRRWLEPEFEDVKTVGVSHHKNSRRKSAYLKLLFPIARALEKAGLSAKLRISAKQFVADDHMLVTARKRIT